MLADHFFIKAKIFDICSIKTFCFFIKWYGKYFYLHIWQQVYIASFDFYIYIVL